MDIAELEARVERLERAVAALQGGPPEEVAVEEDSAELPVVRDELWRQVGFGALILGGAYVLRALTESGSISDMTGALLGLAYAVFWIWRGQTIVAALIASALVWEATARFEIFTVAAASALVVIVSLALFLRAVHERAHLDAMVGTALVALTCTGLAMVTADVVPPLLAITTAGVAMSWIVITGSSPSYLSLFLGAASTVLAIAAALLKRPGSVVALLVFAAAWLMTPFVLRFLKRSDEGWIEWQAVAAMLVGLGGALWVSRSPAVIAACFVLGAAAYAVRLWTCGAIAVALGTLATLPLPVVAIVWGAAAVVSARVPWHAAAWSLAAVVAGLQAGPLVLGAVAALIASSVAITRTGKTVLVATATAATIGAAFSLVHTAVGRTAVLALAAVGLYLLGSLVAEARAIARVVLVIGGIKLVAEDLRTSPAAMIVVALAVYGSALTFIARKRTPGSALSRLRERAARSAG